MDIAYDRIQEESFSPSASTSTPDPASSSTPSSTLPTEPSSSSPPSSSNPTLNAEFSQAFTQISSSPWGSAIGGWWSTARKQGETLYADLQKEATEASEQATKGLSSLREQVVKRTRAISLHGEPAPVGSVPGEEGVPAATGGSGTEKGVREEREGQDTRAESLPADIVKEAGTLVASLRTTAASRLKVLQRAEDAADEALLKFGLNVRDFLRDAVTITAPDGSSTALSGAAGGGDAELLFETQEPGTGRKVFHSSRLDAQLHAIHTTAASFTTQPAANEAWEEWEKSFDVGAQTEAIARDLERFEELRRAMEKLVPEKVEYAAFWTRYYFLRKAVEEEERRRREVLKGATSNPSEEIAWDDEEEDEDEDDSNRRTTPFSRPIAPNAAASESTTTLNAPATAPALLKPTSPRRSHEDESNKSVAGSDASYDIISGATSRAMGSPREEKRTLAGNGGGKGEESEEDDWE